MYKLGRGGNSIIRQSDGAFIPVQPGNRDYDEYKEWLAQGNHPDPPEHDDAMTQLRAERDRRLSECDIPWSLGDYDHPDKGQWTNYRNFLRQLPSRIEAGETEAPTLDENYELVYNSWPTKPE